MAYNLLEGTVPPGLGNLPFLEMYNIGFNKIVSSGDNGLGFITSLRNSTRLKFLAFDGNLLQGIIPESIGNLSKVLQKLYMGGNNFYGTIPASIGNLSSLTLLNLSYNAITGEIPVEIGKLENLQMLGLAGNRIFGRIPDSLGNLQKLNKIDLSGNELVGGISTAFGNLHSVLSLDLSNNKLNGSIPKEVLNLPSLTTIFNLSNNFLSPIPGTLGEVKGLGTLDLSYNNLSGFIPPDLQKLQALESLNLAFNNLEGIVPCGGVFTNLSRVQLEGNPKLSLKIGCGNAQDHRRKPVKVYVSVGVAVMATLVVFFSIVGWVQSAFPSRLLQVLDPELLLLMHNLFHDGRNINPEVQQECVITILGIGLSCTMNSPDSRISIRNALHKLKAARNNLLNHVPTHQASKY
ncbi:hypothetical protein GH714_015667 [Hevea brasiliensis]|uniref:Leucine-rich repeat-containing N-terminal plant-type domain-containing protein n=1 Tax=Hevea brasiliensis TaxID=3981 RepID=A0A6A6LH41_HEVBR|nr:hypothetical protein GH714_015667 [Hevea brasiliensis]